MFDYHLHSAVSYDGTGAPAEMLAAARQAGLKEICFTDHLDYLHRLPREETTFTPEAYRNAYDSLSAPDLLIRRGVELGFTPWNKEEIIEDLAKYPYDFVIGSVHSIDDDDPYLPPYWVGRDPLAAEKRYFDEVLACVELHDDFDVLGHLTYITKCKAHPCPRVIPLDEYRSLITQIMTVLIKKGKGIEVNTSAIDRFDAFLPDREYLQLFHDLGGRIVTVGSDAHNAKRVGQHTARALALIKDIFGHVCTFEGRNPIFHNL